MTENEAIKVMKWYSEEEYGKGLVSESHRMAIQALEEIQQYRSLEQKLQSVYGEHDGLLESVINGLVKFENAPDKAIKAVLLIDDNVEKWEQYKAIGTVEECREAVAILKQLMKHCEGSCADCHYKNPNGMECMNDLLKLKGGAE